jgi:hypothetical protein
LGHLVPLDHGWILYVAQANQEFYNSESTLEQYIGVLTSCSIEGADYTLDGPLLTRLNTRRRLNRSRGHHLAFHHTGMRLPNMPIAFLLLIKFSHTANDRACQWPFPSFRQWPLVVPGFKAINTQLNLQSPRQWTSLIRSSLAISLMGSPTSAIMAEGGVIGSLGTARPWQDFVCLAANQESYNSESTLDNTSVETTTVLVISGDICYGTCWTVTLRQPTAVQVEAASRAIVKGTHLCPAKVTVPAQSL